MKNKKIAIITPGFYEQAIGGAEYQSYLFAKIAKDNGLDVHYIYITYGVNKLPNDLGLQIHAVDSPKYRKYLRYFGKTAITCIPKTWRILKKINPDVIYCRSGVVQAGLAAYYGKKFKKKSIWHAASVKDIEKKNYLSYVFKPLTFLDRMLVEYGIKNSSLVLCQAVYQKELLLKNFGRNSVIQPNIIPVLNKTIVKDKIFTVVWIANIKVLKQPELFIKLAKKFSTYKNIQFIMIGKPSKGKYQDYLNNKIRDTSNLHFLRFQTMDQVNRLLSKSHLLVNTSLYEGFSNTFLQAWMKEVPVCSLNVDPDGLLKEKGLGFFSKTIDSMVKDILLLYKNPFLLKSMGVKAKEYVYKNHSLDKNTYKIIDLLTSNE